MTALRPGITGIGGYVPERILTNHDLEQIVDTSDEWIRTRTGIRERHIAADDETTDTMAVAAARDALTMAGVAPTEVDMVLVATATPTQLLPSTSAYVQRQLGAKNAAGFDLSAACAGFIYALEVAAQFIATGKMTTVLAIGAETLSRVVDWQDRATCVLFADGAGAAVVQPVDRGGILASRIFLDGELGELIEIPGGGSRYPMSPEIIEKRLCYIKMRGNEVFRIAVRYMGLATQKVLADAGLNVTDIDWFVPHQANERITYALADFFKLPRERVYNNIAHYGNTSAASIPLALCEMREKKLLESGQKIVCMALGAGISYAALAMEWSL